MKKILENKIRFSFVSFSSILQTSVVQFSAFIQKLYTQIQMYTLWLEMICRYIRCTKQLTVIIATFQWPISGRLFCVLDAVHSSGTIH